MEGENPKQAVSSSRGIVVYNCHCGMPLGALFSSGHSELMKALLAQLVYGVHVVECITKLTLLADLSWVFSCHE